MFPIGPPNGEIDVEPLRGYDDASPDNPIRKVMETGKPLFIEPYEDEFMGEKILAAKFLAPVFFQDRVVAVVGLEFSLAPINKEISKIKVFERGFLSVISYTACMSPILMPTMWVNGPWTWIPGWPPLCPKSRLVNPLRPLPTLTSSRLTVTVRDNRWRLRV